MSLILERNAKFMGVPFVVVRNILKAWRYGQSTDAHDIAVRKDVKQDPRTVLGVLEEFRDRSFMGPEEQEYGRPFDGLTELGKALVSAKGTKRVGREKAQQVLDEFLASCASVNARSDIPFHVREVWLFGSMIDPIREEVADIDLVPVYDTPPNWSDPKERRKKFHALANELGGSAVVASAGVFGAARAQSYVINHFLHGGRRHRLLAVHEMHELLALTCSCRLIFDSGRGGLVDDPPLSRHPQSETRATEIRERPPLPDTTAVSRAPRPLPAGAIKPGHFKFRSMISVGPWGDEWRFRVVQSLLRDMDVVTDEQSIHRLFGANVVTRRLNARGLDGRARFALFVSERDGITWSESRKKPNLGIVVERHIQEEEAVLTYRLHIHDATHKGRVLHANSSSAAIWFVHLLASADIERLLRRDLDAGRQRDVVVVLDGPADRPTATELVAEVAEYFNGIRKHMRKIAPARNLILSALPTHVRAFQAATARA